MGTEDKQYCEHPQLPKEGPLNTGVLDNCGYIVAVVMTLRIAVLK